MKHHEYITDERIIENLKVYRRENFLRKFNLMTISILYSVIMICIIAMIYGSQQQKMTSNVTITYKVPTYTITFDPQGGGVSPSSKQVKLGNNYGDLPTPTRTGYSFLGWSLESPGSYPEYIESTGTQYIDTGFVANGGMVAEYKTMYFSYGYVVGSHNVSYPYGRNGCWLRADKKWELGYGETCPTGSSGSLNTIYTVKFSTLYNNAYLEVDGTRIISTSGQNVSTNNVYLLSNDYTLATPNSTTLEARIYYVKIWDANGNLVRDYVPYINSQGQVGMLDKVNNKFYGNNGSGVFHYSNNTSSEYVTSTTKLTTIGDHLLYAKYEPTNRYPNYIESTGTQYIDTGFVANGGMVVEYKAMFLNYGYIVGSHNVSSPYGRNGGYLRFDGKWELGYGETAPGVSSGSLNTIYTVKFSTLYNNAYLEVNGTRIISSSGQNVSTNNVYLLTNSLGMINNELTKARIYYVKIYESGGNIIRDYVPYINAQGEVGMLDRANSSFYGNDGTGTFSYG